MAAIIHPQHRSTTAPGAPSEPRPHLVLIEGGSEAALRRRQPAAVYRRRRLAAAGVVVALVALVAVGSGVLSQPGEGGSTADATAPAARGAVVVQPGDTLWSIARSLQPEGDVRSLVDDLAQANGGASVRAGQRVVLPAG